MQITADISKILKTVQRDLTFIFDVLPEVSIGFVSFLVFLALENVVIFPRTCFIKNKEVQLCVAMWKRFRPILAIVWHNIFWQDIFLIENRNFEPPLQSVILRKRDVPNTMFLYFS